LERHVLCDGAISYTSHRLKLVAVDARALAEDHIAHTLVVARRLAEVELEEVDRSGFLSYNQLQEAVAIPIDELYGGPSPLLIQEVLPDLIRTEPVVDRRASYTLVSTDAGIFPHFDRIVCGSHEEVRVAVAIPIDQGWSNVPISRGSHVQSMVSSATPVGRN
jgi:hypothetical protein